MNEKGKKVIKAGIGYTIGNYLIKGLSFFTIPIFARLMTTDDYGIYNTYAAYDGIFFVIIGLALHSSFKNARYKYGDKFNEYVSSCSLLSLISLIIWLLLGNVFYSLFGEIIGFSRFVTNILFLNSYANAIILYFNSYIGLYYEFKAYFKIAVINAVFSVILSMALILSVWSNEAYLGRILGTAIPAMMIAGYIIFYFFRKSLPKYDKGYWKFALNYSLPIIPHGLSQVVLSQFDRIMITSMVGTSESGIYSFGYNIYTLINVTASALDNVWGPWFYEQMEKKRYESIKQKGLLYAVGMLAFCSLIVLASPEIVVILGGQKYYEATYVVAPIVMGGFFSFLYTLPVQVEYYYAKTKCIALGTMLAAALNVIFNYIFILLFGYVAAAYTTLVTYFLYFLFHFFLAKKIQGFSLFDTSKMFFICIIALAVDFIAIALVDLPVIRWLLFIIIAVGIQIYVQKHFKILTLIKVKFSERMCRK